MDEEARILNAYEARALRRKPRYFGYENLAHVQRIHERYFQTLRELEATGFHPLSQVRILDVGCGDGSMLRQFLQWGAAPENLAGIELRSELVRESLRLSPNLDIRSGSATKLPWADGSFDLVCQHTVFTSILANVMKQKVASEMTRVLCPRGAVLWYDFMYDNPWNPDVRGVKAKEIRALFPGFEIRLRRMTLASPIARKLPSRFLRLLYPLLASIVLLRTHYLGLLIKVK